MAERATEDQRTAPVDRVRILLGGQYQTAARPTQRLVCRRCHQMGMGNWIFIAGEDLAGHQAREVRHVDHEGRAHLVRDLAHRGEVDPPRIGGVAGDQDQRLELSRRRAYRVVVQQLGFGSVP